MSGLQLCLFICEFLTVIRAPYGIPSSLPTGREKKEQKQEVLGSTSGIALGGWPLQSEMVRTRLAQHVLVMTMSDEPRNMGISVDLRGCAGHVGMEEPAQAMPARICRL